MRAVGNETVAVVHGEIAVLTPPRGARYACIVCEPDASASDKTKAVRFWSNGDSPTSVDGLSLGTQRHTHWIPTRAMMLKFKVTGVESGKIHNLPVEYYR